jgi:sulfur carrier protein
VAQLLEFLAIDSTRIAVELNRSIVRKQDWAATSVEEGAQLEIVWFVGGG